MKYIVDTDDFEPLFDVDSIGVFGIGKSLSDSDKDHSWSRIKSIGEFEELNADYVNEHFGDLQDTAYQKGFEDGKWKSEDGCTGCKYEGKVVTGQPCISCCNSYKNQWTAKSDKIEVGDEVKHKEYKNRFVVTKMQNGYIYGISKDGSWNNFRNDGSFVKTGRHFDIDKILEEMRT